MCVTLLVESHVAGQTWRDRQQAWDKITAVLAQRVSFRRQEMPLADAVRALGQQLGVNIVVDQQALEDSGMDASESVSTELSDVSLASLLDALLDPLDLTWTIHFESILITTPERDESDLLLTRLYVVSDLVQVSYADGVEEDYESLVDLLVSTVATETWAENGGGVAEIRPLPSTNALVISQTFQVHRQIEQLLADVRDARRAQGLAVVDMSSSFASDKVFSRTRRQPAPRHRTYLSLTDRWRTPRLHGE
jgi:type II secretory pathway component GspD/PulD (secretin)